MENEKKLIKKEQKDISWSKWEGIIEIESESKNNRIEVLIEKLINWYSSVNKGDFNTLKKECLTKEEIELLDCNYRSGFDGISYFTNDEGITQFEHRIWIDFSVKGENQPISLLANSKGIIRDNSVQEIANVLKMPISEKELNSINTIEKLEEFLVNNAKGRIDFRNLTNIIEKNIMAKNIRNKIIEYVTFRLNYSNSVYGSMLAKRFVKDMKEQYENDSEIIKQESLVKPKIRLKKKNIKKA